MRLTVAQADRACGALLGSAAGDALGVPYEFATPPAATEFAVMRGGGLGNLAPGEWSDDTSMAVAIAEVAAQGADLADASALDAIAEGFLRWYDDGPPDIGIQTRAVLSATRRVLDEEGGRPAEVMTLEAATYAAEHARSAGNGALMRTAPVALAHLADPERLAQAARLVARLTHADPLAGDSCVIWCQAIRTAVLTGEIDVRAGLPYLGERRERWETWLDEAESRPASQFSANGFTVTALQAAVAALSAPTQRAPDDCRALQDALHAAVRIGHDTDTVAAITGALAGARWGASAVPWNWRRAVHGWPGRDGRDLVSTATLIIRGGEPDNLGWPMIDDVGYHEAADAVAVPHPYDDGVLLGTHRSRGHGADAVVSLCRVGRRQACFEGATDIVESRLMDSDDPADNPDLPFLLHDAAEAVRGLRAEGKRVLLHCVAAHQRTPSVAVAYAVLLGHDPAKARTDVLAALPSARGRGRVWEAAVPHHSQATPSPSLSRS